MEMQVADESRKKQEFVSWLRDAHAMEVATIDNISRIIPHLSGFPEVADRYSRHFEESQGQAARLERALDLCNAHRSTVKETAMRGVGIAESFITKFSPDAPLKDLLAGYAYEHFEIISYRSLIAAAEHLGETQVASLCRMSLQEEEDMADVIARNIASVTGHYLEHPREKKGLAIGSAGTIIGLATAAVVGAALVSRYRSDR